MKNAINETVEKLDAIPEPIPLLVNLCIAGFVCLAHGGALLLELTCETGQVDSIKPLASITLPIACLVIISSLLALKWVRARRAILGVHATFLTAGALASFLWATGILFKGIPKGSNFAWTPGILSGLCAYSFYLLRRTVLVKFLDYAIIKYLHLIVFIFVFSVDVLLYIKVTSSIFSSPRDKFFNQQTKETENPYAKLVEVTSEGGKHFLHMSVGDTFVVEEMEEWDVDVCKPQNLPYVEVVIEPKIDKSFSMKLFFMRDTPDMANFDTPDKVKKFIMASSMQIFAGGLDKKIVSQKLELKGWYGWYIILPDTKLENKVNIPEGDFKYATRGMIRLSSDSVIWFMLLTNELDTPKYKRLFDFACSFIKEKN